MARKTHKRRLNDLDGKDWVKSTKSWFVINPRPRPRERLDHPAKFPEELVKRLTRFFTKPGDWVLDPFAGTGSTQRACSEISRNCVGIELNPAFVEQTEAVSGDVEIYTIVGDSRDARTLLDHHFNGDVPEFQYIITSPPYFDMLRKSRGGNESTHKQRETAGLKQYYSDDEADLGNITEYDQYLEAIGEIFDGLHPLLADRAYLTVVAQNMRDVDGTLRPIAWDLARRLSQRYELKQEMIWCQDNKRLGCWGFPSTYVSNVHHHYCLVLQRES
ncbi:MAG: DNA methyltransferase [Candidatus Thorarchaeota archaeon]